MRAAIPLSIPMPTTMRLGPAPIRPVGACRNVPPAGDCNSFTSREFACSFADTRFLPRPLDFRKGTMATQTEAQEVIRRVVSLPAVYGAFVDKIPFGPLIKRS